MRIYIFLRKRQFIRELYIFTKLKKVLLLISSMWNWSLLDFYFEVMNVLHSLKRCVPPQFLGSSSIGECEECWTSEPLKRPFSLAPNVRCNAPLIPSELSWVFGGVVNWERTALYVIVFLAVVMALRLKLFCIYTSASISGTGCFVCFSSVLCKIPCGSVLALGGYCFGRALSEMMGEVVKLHGLAFCLTKAVAKT